MRARFPSRVVLTAGVSPVWFSGRCRAGRTTPLSRRSPTRAANAHVAGEFRGSAYFGGVRDPSQGLSDLFVAKYSASGALIYVRTAGGPSARPGYRADTVDAAQNVDPTGYFTTSATLPESALERHLVV